MPAGSPVTSIWTAPQKHSPLYVAIACPPSPNLEPLVVVGTLAGTITPRETPRTASPCAPCCPPRLGSACRHGMQADREARMRWIYFATIILFAAATTVFVLQNFQTVTISFLGLEARTPLA